MRLSLWITLLMTMLSTMQVHQAQATPSAITSAQCYQNGWDKARWLQFKDAKFQLDTFEKAFADAFASKPMPTIDTLAKQLRFCLAEIDPEIRDGIAYFGLANWLREDMISPTTRLFLFNALLQDIQGLRDDPQQVYLPFAVLVLSEVVRADRITPYLNTSQRQQVIDTIAEYLAQNSDYRGFDDQQGWRHSVAHSADVMLQLVLNKQLSEQQLMQVSEIVADTINPDAVHFYHFDEPQRLMRPIVYAMLREELSAAFWQQWIDDSSKAVPLKNWGAAFDSRAGLAKRHNTKAFFQALYVTVATSGSEKLASFTPEIEKALAKF